MKHDMVNSPSHYCTEGRPECIELINDLICGHDGVSAFCIGQVKYLYRAGKKAESGMTMYEKAIEDVSKFLWYINFIIKKIESYTFEDWQKFLRQRSFIPETRQHFIANEFSFGKEEDIGERIYFIVIKLANITNINTYYLIRSDLEDLIDLMEVKKDEE